MKYTRKEIKAVKREIKENGVLSIGYWHDIFEEIDANDLIYAIKDVISEYGLDSSAIANMDDLDFQHMIVQYILDNSNYQVFKNKYLPHLLCHH